MLEKLNKLNDGFYASPQILPDEVQKLADDGFDLIINNRPDGEEPGQPMAQEIEAAAAQAGVDYIAIPIGRDGISVADMEAFNQAVDGRTRVLGFCRTGTRSTMLRSLAGAKAGQDIDTLADEAANGGYDISGQRPVMERLSQG